MPTEPARVQAGAASSGSYFPRVFYFRCSAAPADFVSIRTSKLLWNSIQQSFAGLFPAGILFKLDLSPDARVFGYAFALSILTGILFGLSPALQFSRADIAAAVKDGGAFLPSAGTARVPAVSRAISAVILPEAWLWSVT